MAQKLTARPEITSGLTLNDLVHIVNGGASWKVKLSTLFSSITGTGALTSGSINSGFGAINVGANSITGGAGAFSAINPSVILGANDNTAAALRLRAWNATNHNWQLDTGVTSNDFNIAPSTVAGGTTFTTPVFRLTTTGLVVTGTLSSTNTISNTFNGGTVNGINLKETADASGSAFISFRKSSDVVIGSVTRVTTTDAVAYNTTSDRDRKENIRTFTDSGAIIDGLRPVLFNWRLDPAEEFVTGKEPDTVEPDTLDAEGKTVPGKVIEGKPIKTRRADLPADRKAALAADSTDIVGFIAQEEQLVDPLLIRSGAVTLDAQGVARWRSDAALVPILVAELKALRARVNTLEARP